MSEKQRWPLSTARRIAEELQITLATTCERIVIAGSIRRDKAAVGDIELLYIPRMETRPVDMFTSAPCNLTDELIGQMLAHDVLRKRPSKVGTFSWGEKNKLAIHTASGIPVDLFATTAANWYVSLVIRTGSKETNLALTTGANKRGGSLQAYGCGVQNSDNTITPATSERHVFDLCGVKYLEPHQR